MRDAHVKPTVERLEMVVAKNLRPHRTRSLKPALPETLPTTSRLVESHIRSCAVEVPPGVARTLAPALVRYLQ